MEGDDAADRLRPTGLTGARLIAIVLIVLVLLVATLGLVEWINQGVVDGTPADAEASLGPLPGATDR